MIVRPGARHEDRVGLPGEGVEHGGHVLAQGRRVGDVEDAVEALSREAPAEAGVVLAIAGDGAHAGGKALGAPAPVEHRDLVAAGDERLGKMQADELGAAHDQRAHDGGILAQGDAMGREVAVTWLGDFKTEVRIGPHRLVADEPVDKGGDDAGPTPVDLVLAALGA